MISTLQLPSWPAASAVGPDLFAGQMVRMMGSGTSTMMSGANGMAVAMQPDLDAAFRRRVLVVHAPRGNAVAVAEHTLALLLALVRHLPAATASLKAGRYKFTISDRDSKLGFNLLGPTSKAPANLTGVKFVGNRSVAVKLTAGKWTYYTNLGTIHYFRVTA